MSEDRGQWFFDDAGNVARLLAEVESWAGTPFREYSKAKGPGGGVDCVRLCESILCNVGLMDPFEFPRVPMDFTQHQERSIILEYLRGHAWRDAQSARLSRIFAELGINERLRGWILPGDLLAFKIGKAVNHLGVALNDHDFVHCFRPVGVVPGTLKDATFAKRLQTVFRARAQAASAAGAAVRRT